WPCEVFQPVYGQVHQLHPRRLQLWEGVLYQFLGARGEEHLPAMTCIKETSGCAVNGRKTKDERRRNTAFVLRPSSFVVNSSFLAGLEGHPGLEVADGCRPFLNEEEELGIDSGLHGLGGGGKCGAGDILLRPVIIAAVGLDCSLQDLLVA